MWSVHDRARVHMSVMRGVRLRGRARAHLTCRTNALPAPSLYPSSPNSLLPPRSNTRNPGNHFRIWSSSKRNMSSYPDSALYDLELGSKRSSRRLCGGSNAPSGAEESTRLTSASQLRSASLTGYGLGKRPSMQRNERAFSSSSSFRA